MQSHCIQTKSIWHITKHKNMTYELDIFFSKENTTKDNIRHIVEVQQGLCHLLLYRIIDLISTYSSPFCSEIVQISLQI